MSFLTRLRDDIGGVGGSIGQIAADILTGGNSESIGIDWNAFGRDSASHPRESRTPGVTTIYTSSSPPFGIPSIFTPLDSSSPRSINAGVGGPLLTGVLTAGSYAYGYWKQRQKEIEKAKAALKKQQERDAALARQIKQTALRNQQAAARSAQAVQRMQGAQAHQASSDARMAQQDAERKREYDLARSDRLAREAMDRARRTVEDQRRMAADRQARIDKENERIDAEKKAEMDRQVAAHNAKMAAKQATRTAIAKVFYQDYLRPWLLHQDKPKNRTVYATAPGGGGVTQRVVALVKAKPKPKRKRRRKRKAKKTLTRHKRRRVA